MSAPDPDRPSLTPVRQQPSAIRIVPYSPPRAADSSEDLQPQSGAAAEFSDFSRHEDDGDDEDDDDDDDGYGSNWRRTNQTSEKKGSSRRNQGPVALPSTAESRLLLAKQEDGVSGDKSATGAGTSGDGPRYHRPTTVAPAGPPPSNVASLAAINALHAPPTRGRLSASSYTTHTSLSSRHSASSHLSDAEPSSSSRASRSPSTGQRRPASSRRGGFVAVLNEDKTFSLVPQRPRPDPEPEPQPSLAQDPRSSSALSDYSGPGAGFRSPHLPFYPSTPRVSQASSHEGYTSYASSQYDRPSSAFTSTGTIPDRSITPSTPVPSSPGSSTVHDFDDPIAETSSTPQTNRLVGGLRKVPKTPDLKWKQTDHSPSSDTTETPLPAVPESSPQRPAGDELDQPEAHSTGAEQASVHSNTPSGGSDPNYIVYEPDSQAPSEAGQEPGEERAPGDSQLDPDLREQASFDSQQTVSTEFESTNIKIYGHSGSEESEEALPEPPIEGAPSDSGSGQFVPPLQTQPSFRSIQSGASTTSDNTNYKVYGPSSPGLPPVPEAETPQETNELRPAQSFLSAASTNSEAANWQVYGRASPATLASVESFNPPSPSGSYAPLIRPTSPPEGPSLYAQEEEGGPSGTSDNEANYVVHGDPTPDPSPNRSPEASPPGTAVRPPRAGYSQESPAQQPSQQLRRQPSSEGLGYYRSRSRSIENLRTKKSWRSGTSVSSIINEDAEDFFAGQAFLNEPEGQWEPSSVAGPSERQRQLDEQRERERRQAEERASWAEETEGPAPMALPTTPHQWSSQLSTVMSETEPGSSGGGTRSASLAPIFNPRAGYHGTVRDHDEDGDGLADLQQITPRPSRQRLSDFFASSNSSERNLHSSHSSRSQSSSLNSNTIPTWARLYYGSGERKFLRNMSISSMSDLGSSRPGSVQNSGSPTTDHFPLGIYSPRRRPHEGRPESAARRQSATGSMDIEPAPATHEDLGIRRGLRRITSSVWSPHLRRDVRARDRYSVWDPPSVSWSAESGMFGRRNAQVVLFVFGFIFPFAWMIGAVLPLPKPSPLAMLERYSSISDFGVRSREHEFERHIETVDELRHENATWWRTLNRFMSVVGLLIIGAVVGLAVAAVKKGWGRN
ncbi:hypothetical protein INS49_006155 [Diaporthe citri]|uniref:uncharacterized protein n=1 Tax=Diaporthe citri TaxID=83186 RepID=UPI001C7E7C51|nr:uncharacterized protein INS49_006155 [Diaporthe citri]KAG6364553.1 hypothetical protein INS49_006155 [Diaporthe citri]